MNPTPQGFRRRFTACLLLAVMTAGALLTVEPAYSEAMETASVVALSRAVVYVDAGTGVVNYCITFNGTVSGIDAIELAGLDTVVSGYGGLGSAVCAIDGKGCSSDACLTCNAPNFWNYLRSTGGAPFAVSAAGASATTVGDGDVEGWVWGSRVTPPTAPSVDSVCGPAPTTTTATASLPPTQPPPPAPTAPPGAPGATSQLRPEVPSPTAAPSGPATFAPSTTVGGASEIASGPTTTAPAPTTERAAEEASAADADEVAIAPDVDVDDGDSSTSWLGLGVVLVLLAAVATWIVALRRRRVG